MFKIGIQYSRSKDIHDKYGGSRQSGISPSASHLLIFLFTGDSGEEYGYEDGWHPSAGTFPRQKLSFDLLDLTFNFCCAN